MLNWDRLRGMVVFASVVESGSMTSAADKLGMTASAVSQHIRQLEQSLGVTLLHRSTRKLTLSEAGRHFYPGTAAMISAVREAEEGLQILRDQPVGEVKITAPLGLSHGPLNGVLIPFMQQYPGLKITLDCSDAERDLIAEGYDLAIRFGPLKDSALVAQRLTSCRMMAVATPAYLDNAGIPQQPEQLMQLRWILSQPQTSLSLQHTHGQRWQGKVKAHLVGSDILLQRQWCLAHMGVSIQPYSEIIELLADETLVPVLPDWQSPSAGLYAVTPGKDIPAKVKMIIDALKLFFRKYE